VYARTKLHFSEQNDRKANALGTAENWQCSCLISSDVSDNAQTLSSALTGSTSRFEAPANLPLITPAGYCQRNGARRLSCPTITWGSVMERSVVKRSIVIGGHKTSVSLEDPFWAAMKEIAAFRRMTLAELIGQIDADRDHSNLSSAIRLFVLDHYMSHAPAREAATSKAKVGADVRA